MLSKCKVFCMILDQLCWLGRLWELKSNFTGIHQIRVIKWKLGSVKTISRTLRPTVLFNDMQGVAGGVFCRRATNTWELSLLPRSANLAEGYCRPRHAEIIGCPRGKVEARKWKRVTSTMGEKPYPGQQLLANSACSHAALPVSCGEKARMAPPWLAVFQ